MKHNNNKQQIQPFRRPENILIILLCFCVILYIWVTLNYFLSPSNSTSSSISSISTTKTTTIITTTPITNPIITIPTTPSPKLILPNNEIKSSLRSNNNIVNIVNKNNKNNSLNDLVTAIVECQTNVGNLIIDVRENWSPLGSQRYLELVKMGFFENLPFFRVCPRYITQFGVKYNWHSSFKSIPDDPSLWNKRDMNYGYLFFAGSGKNSRNDQMVISFCQTDTCKLSGLGHADWEVPLGTIRRTGFNTLVNIEKTGFPYPSLEMIGLSPNAHGPDQYKIRQDENYLLENYPNMAYWLKCNVIQENIEIQRDLTVDYNLETDTQPFDFNRYKQNLKISPTITGKETHSIFVEFLIVLNGNNDKNGPPINLPKRVVIEIIPQWSPLGAKRFIELVETLYFDNAAFFRVIHGFMAQFGISSIPSVSSYWRTRPIQDDPVLQSNSRGTITFATGGKNTRTSQLFINFVDNKYLDKEGFTPIGRIVEGMDTVIDNIYYGYGEGGRGDGSDGKGPGQGRINQEGKKYLDKLFPKLSYIKFATVLDNYIPS